MPKRGKTPRQAIQPSEDSKLYAHIYAARLSKQVASELEPSRRVSRRRKKGAPNKP
jgi:hypothetical protein